MVNGVVLSKTSPLMMTVAPAGTELMVKGTRTDTGVVVGKLVLSGCMPAAGWIVATLATLCTAAGLTETAATGMAASRHTIRRMQRIRMAESG
jgi:hypothetical protein